MATVMERGAVTTRGRGRPRAEKPSRLPLTLADLITAIQDVVGPEDDGLVVAIVRHLLRSRRLGSSGCERTACCGVRHSARRCRHGRAAPPQPPRQGPRASCIAVPDMPLRCVQCIKGVHEVCVTGE
jgi:hypothetical protein